MRETEWERNRRKASERKLIIALAFLVVIVAVVFLVKLVARNMEENVVEEVRGLGVLIFGTLIFVTLAVVVTIFVLAVFHREKRAARPEKVPVQREYTGSWK